MSPDVTSAEDFEVRVGTLAARAETERSGGRYEAALELGHRCVARSPSYSSAHFVLGRCFLEMGEPSRALEHLGKAVELDGENARALLLLGDTLALEGLAEEAGAMYERAAAAGGESEDARMADRILRLGKSDAARPDLAEEAAGIVRGSMTPEEILEASDLRLQDEFETVTMAGICEEQGILDAALRIYDSLVEKYPDASLLVGKTAQLKRRIAEAAEAGNASGEMSGRPRGAERRAGLAGSGTGDQAASEGAGEWTKTDSKN